MELSSIKNFKENNRLEIKKAENGIPKSIWETISAFANTDGGLIILGLQENVDKTYEAIDIDIDKYKKEFWDIMNNKTKISSNFLSNNDVYSEIIDGKELLFIKIPRVDRRLKPIYINADIYNGSYKRNHEGDYHCSVDEVNAMIAEANKVSLDTHVVSDYDVSRLSSESIKGYRQCFVNVRPSHIWNKLDDNEFLLRVGACKKIDGHYYASEAGLLFFGYDWEIIQYFPYYFLDYRYVSNFSFENRWEERIVTGFGECGAGNIFEFFMMVTNAINEHLKVPFSISKDGFTRKDDTDEKHVIREALINALTNADYRIAKPVKVLLSKETLAVENPGRYLVSVERALTGGESEPRNQAIMRLFNAIGFGDQAGYGVSVINDYVTNRLHKTLDIKEYVEPDRSIMIVPLKESTDILKHSLSEFLSQLEIGKSFKTSEIIKKVDLPRSTLNYQINKAVSEGEIAKGNKNGIYIKAKR